MDRQLEANCKNKTGLDKVREIRAWYDGQCYMRPSDEKKDELLMEVLSASALAFYENALYERYSPEEIETTAAKKDTEPVTAQDAPFDMLGLLLAYAGNNELSDKIILLWDKYAKSQTTMKSAINGFYLGCFDSLGIAYKNRRNGIIFKLSYIFLTHDRKDEATFLETVSVSKIVYDFPRMPDVNERIIRDYYSLIKDDERLFGFFLRKLDRKFAEYEKYLGETKEEIIRHGLEDIGTPVVSYRILRGLYTDTDVCDPWHRTVMNSNAGEQVKNWCELYFLLTMTKLSIEDEDECCNEGIFWELNDENIDFMPLIDYNDVSNYANKPFFQLACIFNRLILNGWDVHRFIVRLGAKNACRLENGANFSNELTDIYDVSCEAAQKVFNEVHDPVELLFLYMNTHLKFVLPLRDVVERIAELTNGNIGPVFSKYRFFGTVRRTSDKVQELQGRYSVEVLSACIKDGYRWGEIHGQANSGLIDEAERNRRCRLLPISEAEVVTTKRCSYIKDRRISFTIKNCKKTGKTYEGCTILTGDFKGEEEGAEILPPAALDEAEKWLEKIIETKRVEDLNVNFRNALDEPGKYNRSTRFSRLILDAFYALSDKFVFPQFMMLLGGNAYDPINEFYYKPGRGVINVRLEHDKEARDEIREIGRNIAKSNIDPFRKMYIYMNTCLQFYMYLEDFIGLSVNAGDVPVSELMIYRRENEIDSFLFHIIPIKRRNDKYVFRFFNMDEQEEYVNINAKYGHNLTIEKSKLSEKVLQEIEHGRKKALYGTIAEVDEKNREIKLKNVYNRDEIKSDSWLLFNRNINDASKLSEYAKMAPLIAKMKNSHMDFAVGNRYGQFVGNVGSYMQRKNYNTDECYRFFKEWDNDAPMSDENLALKHKNLEEKVSKQVTHLVRGIRENRQVELLLQIYELSYMKFFVPREELDRRINNRLAHL